MEAIKAVTVYAQYAMLVGAEIVAGLAGRWRIGRHIAKALSDGTCEAGKLYSEIEKKHGKGWGKRTLYTCKQVYDAFPSYVSSDGKDCPVWAVPSAEYSGDYGVYTLLAGFADLKTEAARLVWAKFAAGRELSEVKATLKWAKEKATLDAPAASHTARCEYEAAERDKRLKEAADKEAAERLEEAARLEAINTSRAALSLEAAEAEAWEVYTSQQYTSQAALLDIAKLTQYAALEGMDNGQAYKGLVAHVGGLVAHMEAIKAGEADNIASLTEAASKANLMAGDVKRLEALALVLFASKGIDASGWNLVEMEKVAFAQTVKPGKATGKAFRKVAQAAG